MSSSFKKITKIAYLEHMSVLETEESKKQKKLCEKKLKEFRDYYIGAAEKGKYDNDIGERISYIRKTRGIPKEAIYNGNMHRTTFYRAENGTIPSLTNLIKIFYMLNVDIDDFIAYRENTQFWLDERNAIDNGIFKKNDPRELDYLDDLDYMDVPLDIDIAKERIFEILDRRIYIYTNRKKQKSIPSEYMKFLRDQIYQSFKGLDYMLKR